MLFMPASADRALWSYCAQRVLVWQVCRSTQILQPGQPPHEGPQRLHAGGHLSWTLLPKAPRGIWGVRKLADEWSSIRNELSSEKADITP